MLYSIAVFAPLLGSAIAGLFGRAIGDRAAQAVTIFCMILASVCGVASFVSLAYGGGHAGSVHIATWIDSGDFHVAWALRYDTLSAVMVAMVTCVATLIHIYSVGYMSHDNSIARFFSYLSLFSFAMLMLVTADNLLQLFFGWEGVGLASYLLIGFWYHKPSACAAAIKAFLVNRVGDLGFALGIALVFVTFGSIEFSTIFASVAKHQADTYVLFGKWPAFEVIGILLFIGAMGKSAQLGLHVWLPDAMEGPTPVSALIHAATMVTAGVFLVARFSPVLEFAPGALGFITFMGASTALFAATVGCVQNDIKRIIAYSTCSQLGYMFVAAGVGAYQASVFHLLTHAFFKALLFLSAGSVIHAMSDEQDIRKMGGLARKIPLTAAVMWIGSLALAGVPPFAGFYSKDAILEVAYAAHSAVGTYGFWCCLIAAFLTAFYSWRLLIMTFHGKPADQHAYDHAHESPAVMTVPLILLAVGAVLTGWAFHEQLLGEHWQHFWGASIFNGPANHVLHAMHEVPRWVGLAPTVAGIAGIAVAYALYLGMPDVPALLARRFRPIYLFLLNKWYFDELYDAVIVRPMIALSRGLWQVGDATIIDGIPNGLASLTTGGSVRASRLQTGSIAVYAFTMLIGLVVLVSVFLLFR
ncbi:MAG: NADH-quinone oxidoreductase subunit L [Alphaproteobacteria bacterium]|nr:NADH-quinone oxidoreductase subunit L [Alphaproteobacteria bacterium]